MYVQTIDSVYMYRKKLTINPIFFSRVTDYYK